MTKVKNKILSLLIAFTLVFGVFGMYSTQNTYAASKKPAKVTSLSVKKASSTKVKVSWKKAKRAKTYQIYRKAGSGKYKRIKTTKSTSYTVSQTLGKKYYYKVRGINGKKKGAFSSVKSITLNKTTPTPPVTPSVTPSMSSLYFSSQEQKAITFTCKNIDNIKYSYPNCVNIDSATFIDGIVTINMTPVTNGSGYLKIMNTSGTTVYCSIPITVNIVKDVIFMDNFPSTFSYQGYAAATNSTVRVNSCTATVDSSGSSDFITFSFSCTYTASSNKGMHHLGYKIYDADGYVVKSDEFLFDQGVAGDNFKSSQWVNTQTKSSSYTVDFYSINNY